MNVSNEGLSVCGSEDGDTGTNSLFCRLPVLVEKENCLRESRLHPLSVSERIDTMSTARGLKNSVQVAKTSPEGSQREGVDSRHCFGLVGDNQIKLQNSSTS